METPQRLIGEFDKNSVEKVRVTLQEWKGRTYIDIRVYFLDEKGAWLPSKKGITLNVELLGELRKAIDKALAEVEMGEVGEEIGSGEDESRKRTDLTRATDLPQTTSKQRMIKEKGNKSPSGTDYPTGTSKQSW